MSSIPLYVGTGPRYRDPHAQSLDKWEDDNRLDEPDDIVEPDDPEECRSRYAR
jgi:hypothetical protein